MGALGCESKSNQLKVSIMNLVKYEQDGLELWVDESAGLAYAHMRAIARMFGLDDTRTLRRRLEGVAYEGVKTAEVHTSQGMRMVALYPASVVFDLTLEFNPELAKAMGSCGANVYMLGKAGYRVKAVEAAPIVDPVLLPAQQSMAIANAIRHITDTLFDHPRLTQILIDNSMNTIIEKRPILPAKVMRGVVEIATEMGYKVDLSSRTKLGKFIAKLGHQSVKEPRLCNGVTTMINCYEDTPELRESIAKYFS
jgi:hypothetical protein